jgi:hypothetical protein
MKHILLTAALVLAHLGNAFAGDYTPQLLPKEFHGSWCAVDLNVGRALRNWETYARSSSNCPDGPIKLGATSFFSEEAGTCKIDGLTRSVQPGVLSQNKVHAFTVKYRCIKASNPEFLTEMQIERGKLVIEFLE